MKTTISDLIDIIHFTIIKNDGSNDVILEELKAIGEKISAGKLNNYVVDVPLFRVIVTREYKEL